VTSDPPKKPKTLHKYKGFKHSGEAKS
jgi:hypothetical protein